MMLQWPMQSLQIHRKLLVLVLHYDFYITIFHIKYVFPTFKSSNGDSLAPSTLWIIDVLLSLRFWVCVNETPFLQRLMKLLRFRHHRLCVALRFDFSYHSKMMSEFSCISNMASVYSDIGKLAIFPSPSASADLAINKKCRSSASLQTPVPPWTHASKCCLIHSNVWELLPCLLYSGVN